MNLVTLFRDVDVFYQSFKSFSFLSFTSWQNNALLARRLLNGELEPAKILNMSPNE